VQLPSPPDPVLLLEDTAVEVVVLVETPEPPAPLSVPVVVSPLMGSVEPLPPTPATVGMGSKSKVG
jgi:hypothetical protein